MFSGFNNFIKYILPKRLFYRALIIVAAPTIILQIIITVVFYDSIWIKANKNITRSLVTQLKAIEEVYQNDKTNRLIDEAATISIGTQNSITSLLEHILISAAILISDLLSQ